MKLIEHDAALVTTAGQSAVHYTQEIPQDFLDDLADNRTASSNSRAGEEILVASVPMAVVELWLRQGFDVFREPHKAILKRLREQNLDAFIATNKAI